MSGVHLTLEETNPLLVGPIIPALLRFALPNMAAMLATALAAIAETSYVGHFGTPALAGMALVFPFVMLQTMMSAGAMGGGVSSAISRALGAGDSARANALAAHALWIAFAMGAAYLVLMEFFGSALLYALGGRGEALAQAVAYSEVAFAGSIFVWIVNTLASVIRGSGNMKIPSITLFALSVAQVVFGGALGLGWGPLPELGMQGVAAGGVIAYCAGAAYLWIYLASGRAQVNLSIRRTVIDKQQLKEILRVLGLVVAFAPDWWTTLYTRDESVLQSARSYFLWAGPFYGLFGLGLSLYFSSLGAGKALGPVLAGTLRLFIVAVGGALLAWLQAPAWAIFALVGAGMAIYGLSTLLIVRSTDWG